MDYRHLTNDELAEIRRQKLHAIEVDHARLALDLRCAEQVGIAEGEQVELVRSNLLILERQHAELLDEINPPAPDEPPRVADNGSSARRPDALASLPARS